MVKLRHYWGRFWQGHGSSVAVAWCQWLVAWIHCAH